MTAEKIHQAISKGLVASCHDCSEGGLAVALAEMAFAGALGIEANLKGLPKAKDCLRTDSQLFSESNSRYIVEVAPENYGAFAKSMLNVPFGQIGKVIEDQKLLIKTVEQNLQNIEGIGYKNTTSFILPKSSWTDNYYSPMQKKIDGLKIKYKDNKEAMEIVNSAQHEINMFKGYSDHYGYCFFILQKKD